MQLGTNGVTCHVRDLKRWNDIHFDEGVTLPTVAERRLGSRGGWVGIRHYAGRDTTNQAVPSQHDDMIALSPLCLVG